MAFTVSLTFDFRGTDSNATKRTARIGSMSLSDVGTPTYSSAGISCNGTGQGLIGTLPSFTYSAPFWVMCALRRTGSTDNANAFGMIFASTPTYPSHVLQLEYRDGTGARVATNDGIDALRGTVASGNRPTLNTDEAWTLKRLNTSATIHSASTLQDTYSFAASWPSASGTASLLIGTDDVAQNVNTRYDWLIIGTGDITTSEMATIQASPNTYLYPASAPSTPAFGRYGVRGPVR